MAARWGGVPSALAFLDLDVDDFALAAAVLDRTEEQAVQRDTTFAKLLAAEIVNALGRAFKR